MQISFFQRSVFQRSVFQRSERKLAGIMVIMLLSALLFSFVFIISEADHECKGDECPVCSCIQLCESVLSNLGLGVISPEFTDIPVFFGLLILPAFVFLVRQETLVSMKIRLDN